MSHFRRTDAKRKCAQGAMCCCVTIAAHNDQARLRYALLGSDHVNNPLSNVVQAEHGHAKLFGIAVHGGDHLTSTLFLDRRHVPCRGRHIMIGRAKRTIRSS